MTDKRNFWAQDNRSIIAASLPSYCYGNDGLMLTSDGWEFERFERNGELASIPYLRATKDEAVIEAPLVAWAWVQFAQPLERKD